MVIETERVRYCHHRHHHQQQAFVVCPLNRQFELGVVSRNKTGEH